MSATQDAMTPETEHQPSTGSPSVMLALATIGFAVNFWAWALISPLGPLFRQQGTLGSLSESDVALMVAVPVVVGSLGRIVVGALTDHYGGRVMFPIISAVTIVPILFLAFVAIDSYTLILVGGFFLGIAVPPSPWESRS
jgi:NNP family nitrate/nitrite transporter-like MFS transporter